MLLKNIIRRLLVKGKQLDLIDDDVSEETLSHLFAFNYMRLITEEYEENNFSKELMDKYISLFLQGVLNPTVLNYLPKKVTISSMLLPI